MIMALSITLIEFVKLVECDLSQKFGFLSFFRFFRIFKSSFVRSRRWAKSDRTLQFSPPGGELRAGIVGLSVSLLVCLHFFWKTAPTIFLIFCMKLLHDKGKKVTEPDFSQKIRIIQKSRKCGKKWGFLDFDIKWLLIST